MQPDPIMISALQHWVFCPRQAALIHIEQLWKENRSTAEGNAVHQTAHDGDDETRSGQRLVRGLALASPRLGLVGFGDVIVFTPPAGVSPASLPQLLSQQAHGESVDLSEWKCLPVEYKRGRPKKHKADHVQVAAQAMCLEDMLGISIHTADLFYHAVRRREHISIDSALREHVHQAIHGMRDIFSSGVTPAPRHDKRCEKCSLAELCLPQAKPSAEQWFQQRLTASLKKGH